MPPPQDLPQTELAPRKRRRKRDDPQNCLTNSEEYDSDEASPLSCSDVESFQGKIVYNPDGSAFIIDSENESLSNISSADNCTADGAHLAATPNNPKIHSFRVVTANDAQCILPTGVNTDSTVTSINSGTDSNNLDGKSSSSTKITKPILMCFICKLSFGNTKSFGLHANTEHTLNLQENEKNLLNREYSSAIIQRNIDEKPQISFLQPLGLAMQQNENQLKPLKVKNDVDELTAQHLHHSTESSEDQKSRRNNLSDCAESTSSIESLSEDQLKQQQIRLPSSPLASSQSRQLLEETSLKSNNSSLVGMSNSTTSPTSKALNDLLSQQHQRQLTSSLLATFHQQQQLNKLHSNGKSDFSKLGEFLQSRRISQNLEHFVDDSPLTPSKSPNGCNMTTTSTSPPDALPLTISPTSQPAPSFTIGACPEHVNGRPFGVDCSRCEIILNSARLNTGVQISTRNSCKTLKCPQCNWHYKYQETLEIHMREKHPDGESACGYCLAGQQHPRLARGESYTCGYKPYRCDICNYSTTTKGNLSIHMQSDKHLNNMQELSNSQNMNNNSPLGAPVTSGGSNVSGDIRESSHLKLDPKILLPNLPQQQPQNQQQQTQSTPSSQLNSSQNFNSTCSSTNSNKGKSSFRCNVCSYETSVARNLRIHQTSEKHTTNMAILETNYKQLQAIGFLQQQSQAAIPPGIPQLSTLPSLTLQQQKQQQQQQQQIAQNIGTLSNMQSFSPEATALADLAYNQALMYQLFQRNSSAAALSTAQSPMSNANTSSANASLLNSSGNGILPITTSAISNSNTTSGSGTVSSAGLESDFGLSPESFEPPFETDLHPSTVYSCLICTNFNTNQIEDLNQHLLIDRSRISATQSQQDVMLIMNSNYICRLCNYKTPLKANFQLHSKTDKHIQKLNYINHIKEGGQRNEYKLKYNSNNTVQLKCNCCDYYTNSIQKLSLHSQNIRHENMRIIFNHLVASAHINSSNELKVRVEAKRNSYKCDSEMDGNTSEMAGKSEELFNESIVDNVENSTKNENDTESETIKTNANKISAKDADEITDSIKDDNNSINNNNESSNVGAGDASKICVKSAEDLIVPNTHEYVDDGNVSKIKQPTITDMKKAFSCQLCDFKAIHTLGMIQHVKSLRHIRIEQLVCLQRMNENMDSLDLTDVFKVIDIDQTEINRQMFSSLTKNKLSHTYKCNNCDFQVENKCEINQHLISTHPQSSENDFSIISSNSIAHWRLEDDALSNIGRNIDTPIEKDEDIKLERMDAENFEEDYILGENDLDSSENLNTDGSGDFTVLCPLCQDPFTDKKSLEKHVMTIHSVNSDGLARLLNLVDTSHWLNSNSSSSGNGNSSMMAATNKIGKSPGSSASSCADSSDIECIICGTSFKTMSDLYTHSNELQHFQLTGNNEICMCILRACQQQFSTVNSMLGHFKDCHMNAVISERHVYKYRCKLCSLAFKTQEKLNIHSLYHTMREATKCHVCSRNFRSLAALQKHIEVSHPGNTCTAISNSSPITSPNIDKTNEYLDDYPVMSPASSTRQDDSEMLDMQRSMSVAADDQSSISTEVISETTDLDEYINSQTMAEEGYNDPMRKFKCTKCKVAYTHQIYLQQHYKSNLHRRNSEKMSNYPLEKYLDPNRPFKCETCRESFTQKNILLSHYNSVSHLHKKKQSESVTPSTSPTNAVSTASASALEFDRRSAEFDRKSVDFDRKSADFSELEGDFPKRKCSPDNDYDSPKKRFKCEICKVAYAQGSTLDLHMRTVIHQARACRQQEQLQQLQSQLQHQPTTSPNNSNFSSVSPTPSNLSGTGTMDLNESAVSALGRISKLKEQETNNQIYKTLLENFGIDIVKQFNEINKTGNDATARLTNNPTLSNIFLNETAAQSTNTNLITPVQNLTQSGNGDLYFCRHCKKTFSSIFVLKSHSEEVHNEKIPLDVLEKFAEKFKNYYMDSVDSSIPNTDGSDADILDFSAKKCSNEVSKIKAEPQNIRSSSPVLSKLPEHSVQGSQLEHLSQHLNIDPSTLAQKMMEQNFVAANFPQTFGVPGGLQSLQGLQGLQNLPALQGLPSLGLQNLQNLPNMGANPSLNTLDMLNIMQFHQLLSLNFMNLAPPLIFGAAAAAQQANTTTESSGMNIQQNLGRSTASMSSVSSNASDIAANSNPIVAAQKVQLLQHQAAAAQQASNNQKRARTRITDDQLKILRAHFDINNSPSEESIMEMSKKANLPMKVVKHWFRNTLFKERQRNKDSPYNFNNPPSTTLNLEEYERTGQAKVTALSNELNSNVLQGNKGFQHSHNTQSNQNDSRPQSQPSSIASTDRSDYTQVIKSEPSEEAMPNLLDYSNHHNLALAAAAAVAVQQRQLQQHKQSKQKNSVDHHHQNILIDQDGNNEKNQSEISDSTRNFWPCQKNIAAPMYFNNFDTKSESGSEILSRPPTPNSSSYVNINDMINQQIEGIPIATISGGGSQNENSNSMGPPKKFQLNKMFEKSFDNNSNASNSSTSSGKRANRTRFTDYQIKVLQEFFENNSYPKDSDLEYLSKLLLLSPRVIVVWFQNARQKQRKIYENQPNNSYYESEEKKSNINYTCKKCNLVFQRYYELIRHQKSHCFKEENNKKSAKAQIAAAQISLEHQQQQMQQQSLSSEDSSSSIEINNSVSGSTPQQPDQQNAIGGTLFGGGINSQQLFAQGFGDNAPFNLLQSMTGAGGMTSGGGSHDGNDSMDLTQRKRKISESSDNDLNDFKTLNKRYKNDQFEFLYNYFMQNEQNEELKKQDRSHMDFDTLFQYYQMNELKKRGGNFDFLYQYYVQNEKAQKQLASPSLHNSKSPTLDTFGGEKPNFDFLLQYYQLNESKKFFQSDLGQMQESKTDLNHTTAIMKQMLNLIQKQQRSVAALQPSYKTNDQQRPTSGSLASSNASMDSLNDQNLESFNAGVSGITSGRSPDCNNTTTIATTEKQSNKRLRTTILPDQLIFLNDCYQNESNPSRKMLEEISKKVQLKKRVVQVWFQNARAKDKKSRNSRCYTDDDSLHQSSSVASPDPQLDDCKICGIQKVNLQEHIYSREHLAQLAQVKSLLENGSINCLTDQMTTSFDKSPSVTPTPQQQVQIAR